MLIEPYGKPKCREAVLEILRAAVRLVPAKQWHRVAMAHGELALECIIEVLLRAKAAAKDKNAIAPRDNDILNAAQIVLDRGYGKPGPDRSFHGFSSSYDWSMLNEEQRRTLVDLLRLAAPAGAVGDVD
jgi:hypothetical protein